jgi:RimJ/RimL family protein N-acetyltransferase
VPVPAGYRLERWSAAAPDRLVASYAAARSAMTDAPAGDSTFQFPQWTVDSVRSAETVCRERGVDRPVVVAVEPAGNVVGVTEVEIYPGQPELVVQQDTVVVPAHRGHGLGRALKAAMMRWLLTERPGIGQVVTNTAAANRHMIQVNDQIGYTTTRIMVDVEADVATPCRPGRMLLLTCEFGAARPLSWAFTAPLRRCGPRCLVGAMWARRQRISSRHGAWAPMPPLGWLSSTTRAIRLTRTVDSDHPSALI